MMLTTLISRGRYTWGKREILGNPLGQVVTAGGVITRTAHSEARVVRGAGYGVGHARSASRLERRPPARACSREANTTTRTSHYGRFTMGGTGYVLNGSASRLERVAAGWPGARFLSRSPPMLVRGVRAQRNLHRVGPNCGPTSGL